jgi:hypothetical protein
MATWIVGGVVLLIVGGIVWEMIANRRNGKNSCGGDCANCRMSCENKPR